MSTKSWNTRYISRNVSRRRFLAASAAGAGAAALIACGGSDNNTALGTSVERKPGAVLYNRDAYLWPDETSKAVAGGILPDSVEVDNTSGYDPYLGASADTVATEPYEFLMRKNDGPGIKPGTPEHNRKIPHLAESYEATPDLATYTFKLRKGVKFHPMAPVNGREMTIDDWRTSQDRFSQVHPNSPNWKEVVDKVEFPDAQTMVVKAKFSYFPFIIRMVDEDFTFQVMPKELNDKPDIAATAAIGTSYRMVDKYQPSLTQEYKRFDGYWQGKPNIDRWHYPIIPEYANRYGQFIAKNTIAFTPNLREALGIHSEAPEALMIAGDQRDGIPRAIYGKHEAATAPWGDPRVRVAMHKAVNWPGILDFQTGKDKFTAAGIEIDTIFTTHVPSEATYWLDPRKGELGAESANYLYDIAEAKKLMTAAGHANGFDLPLVAQSTSAGTEMWTLYLDEVKKSGVFRIEPELMQNRTAYLDRTTRTAQFRGVQWFSGGSVHGDVDYVLFRNYHSSGQASAYTSPRMDSLIDASRRAPDWERRIAILKDIQIESARLWPAQLGEHGFAPWRFEWPWLHNANQQAHLQWLDQSMPRRNG
jgi:peptide/nickel transport system substrate-binding protein